jgi:hypothetical protein
VTADKSRRKVFNATQQSFEPRRGHSNLMAISDFDHRREHNQT